MLRSANFCREASARQVILWGGQHALTGARGMEPPSLARSQPVRLSCDRVDQDQLPTAVPGEKIHLPPTLLRGPFARRRARARLGGLQDEMRRTGPHVGTWWARSEPARSCCRLR